MSRVLLLSVFLAAASALSLGGQSPSVAVFMDFDNKPAALPLAVMEKEAGDLLKSAGISLDWRLAGQNHGDQTFAGLVVLKFKGQCRVDSWSKPASDFGSIGEVEALGVTRVDRGHVLPYTEVQCDQIRKALAYLRPGAGSRERQNALGLALGRVVAHELYHILARTTAHAKQGLAKATQSLQDLVSNAYMGFGDEVSEKLREALR